MSTLRELIEKHGYGVAFCNAERDSIFEPKFTDSQEYVYGVEDEWSGTCYKITEKGWTLYTKPPKPIVFECEIMTSVSFTGLFAIIPQKVSELSINELKEIEGKRARVTVEVLPESEK